MKKSIFWAHLGWEKEGDITPWALFSFFSLLFFLPFFVFFLAFYIFIFYNFLFHFFIF